MKYLCFIKAFLMAKLAPQFLKLSTTVCSTILHTSAIWQTIGDEKNRRKTSAKQFGKQLVTKNRTDRTLF
jgi:hypothetical protein